MTEQDCCGGGRNARVIFPMAPVSPCSPENGQPSTSPARLDQPFIEGFLDSPSGKIPRVSSALRTGDRLGTIKARIGVGRMHYAVDPGLYALGNPDGNSPVLVTANYKMSFDSLREALPGRNAWILVLDTKGINVWCAAGKGTFGTEELVLRIAGVGLKDIVDHRDIILPQLGAPGVAAHLVKKLSGFRVHYGPIRAQDLPAYLDAGMKATPEMRVKTFPLEERAVLIPIELIAALKAALIIIPVMFLLSGFIGTGSFIRNLLESGVFSATAILSAVFAGAVLAPLLLPYLPGRAFAAKGFFVGFLTALLLISLQGFGVHSLYGALGGSAWVLMISAVSAYLAMNFTGASTYTSLSGVKREMRWALPLEVAAGISGFGLWLLSGFFA